jgi:hypothetical protein
MAKNEDMFDSELFIVMYIGLSDFHSDGIILLIEDLK